MPKKVLIALPEAMLTEVDIAAREEFRTRSDLIREALRRYLGNRKTMQTAERIVSERTIPPTPEKENASNPPFFTTRIQ